MQDTRELRQKRAKVIADARAIANKAEEEKRTLSPEEREQFDRAWKEQGKLKDEIDDVERRNDLEREEAKLKLSQDDEDRKKKADDEDDEEKRKLHPRATEEYRRAFNRYITALNRPSLETEEFRDLQSDDPRAAGYLVVPEEMAQEILKDLNNVLVIRALATKKTVRRAQSLGIRKRSARASTFQWSAEIQDTSGHKDTSLRYGKKVLTPHYLSGEIDVSMDLLRVAENPDQEFRAELLYDAGVIQETAFMEGTGDEKPLGLFVASDDGISTSRDVTSTASADFKADDWISLKYTLKQQYRGPSLRIIIHRDTVARVAKLKDGMGQYLWQPGLKVGEPDAIRGVQVIESEYAPSTYSSGAYVAVIGDLRWYYVADALDIEIRRLDELLARTNQVAYICRLKTDAMPVLEEAFARLKLL